MPAQRSHLAIRIVQPDDSPAGQIEARLLIDGRDLTAEAFPDGVGIDPDRLLGPAGPLEALECGHTVRLAEAHCGEACCGALDARIRRDGDEVVREDWRVVGPASGAPAPGPVRFAADQYAAELARAHADRAWEWPGRTVARLLRALLGEQPEVLLRWDMELDLAASWPADPASVHIVLTTPAGDPSALDSSWRQYRVVVPVTGEPPALQAARALERLRARDPRTWAVRPSRPGHKAAVD